MKKIEYICNRCGKGIDRDSLYSITPYKLDSENDGLTVEMQEDVENELFETLDDKHLCLECLKKTLKFFNAPAVINVEFEKSFPTPKILIPADKIVHGVIAPKTEAKILPIMDIETVKKLQAEDMSTTDMALFFGTTYSKLYKWMQRRDLVIKAEPVKAEPKEKSKPKPKLPSPKSKEKSKLEVKKPHQEDNIKTLGRAELLELARTVETRPSQNALDSFKRPAFTGV